MSATAILLMHCPDQPGLVRAVADFIWENGGNVVHLEQHVDQASGVFFMRVEWDLAGFRIPRHDVGRVFHYVAEPRQMQWTLGFSDEKHRLAIFVTREHHCLFDLLARSEAGELGAEISLVVSNHEDLRPVVERFGIPYHVFRVTPLNKEEQEEKEQALLEERKIDTVVLARYMQVLSERFTAAWQHRIINIHHSFLPAFPGARPYQAAHRRGVKIIGATSHYVTTDLDEGPIIEQDVIRVSHKLAVEELVRQGKDLEKVVLSRAVLWHVRRKVLPYENKTVVFA
ncbi:MAG: formyltetrahydrofolate deformylase [Verrucomicrobiales bacterium]|nr:formyltetrahydrofolate deformylase [Verrucomicrobiales bacterium]